MSRLSRVKRSIKHQLPLPLADAILMFKYRNQKVEGYEDYSAAVQGGRGLEIGGPSTVFKTILPVYQAAKTLDGVNFGERTVWEGGIKSGLKYRYLATRVGQQFIADATDLGSIESTMYDFVLSSNCLEHVANPIRALLEWRRVLRTGGILVLVLPKKAANFDHRRPITTLEHLLDDFNKKTGEDDLTHFEEIMALHDLARDPPAGSIEQFRRRSADNFVNRTLHHHVFDWSTILPLLAQAGFDVVRTSETPTDYYALAQRRE